MSRHTAVAQGAHEENWRPILELAIEEVFEIMLGSQVKPSKDSMATIKNVQSPAIEVWKGAV